MHGLYRGCTGEVDSPEKVAVLVHVEGHGVLGHHHNLGHVRQGGVQVHPELSLDLLLRQAKPLNRTALAVHLQHLVVLKDVVREFPGLLLGLHLDPSESLPPGDVLLLELVGLEVQVQVRVQVLVTLAQQQDLLVRLVHLLLFSLENLVKRGLTCLPHLSYAANLLNLHFHINLIQL